MRHENIRAKVLDQYLKWKRRMQIVNHPTIPPAPETVKRLERMKVPAPWKSWEELERDLIETGQVTA